jgi:hypothetical protein
VIGNETLTSHRVFDKATKTVYGEDYDCEGTVDVQDGDKGGDESYAITFQKSMNYYCFHHLKENVMKHGSNADTGLYTLGTDAPSVSGVDDAVAAMSDKARVFLGKKRQTSVWPACAAEAGVKLMGRKASQTAESYNKSMQFCRSLLPAKMLLEMAKHHHKKYHERRDAAMNCTASVPPKVAEALKDAAGFAKRYTDIGNNLDGTYWVKSMTVGSDTVYTVRYNEDEGTCDCSCGRKDVIDKYICGHVAAVLDKNGLALDRFVRDEVKTPTGKAIQECMRGAGHHCRLPRGLRAPAGVRVCLPAGGTDPERPPNQKEGAERDRAEQPKKTESPLFPVWPGWTHQKELQRHLRADTLRRKRQGVKGWRWSSPGTWLHQPPRICAALRQLILDLNLDS